MNVLKKWTTAMALVAAVGTTQAGLIDRGGGMIYDNTLNITWLADWNYALTSGFDSDGLMDWASANNWANSLVYGGFSDWRLPTALNAGGSGPCGPNFNCTASEIGHMFYADWGATAGNAFSSGTNAANLALFSNVQSFDYWSGTEYAPDTAFAWNFSTLIGHQNFDPKGLGLHAVAVRPGDVPTVVPEPMTVALVLLGGAAILGWHRRAGRRERVLRRLGVA